MNYGISLKKPDILIVDDCSGYSQFLSGFLKESRYRVRLAGEETLFKALKQNLPDLILLEVKHNKSNGFELCLEIKKEDKYASIPIILFTEVSDSESIIRGFEVGAQDYIIKPINPNELLARIESHVRLKKKTEKLQDVYKELESFNHMISHDLKSPIWSLSKLTQYLEEVCAKYEDAEMNELILNIRGKAEETVHLIEKYAELARLSRTSFLFERVDLINLIQEVYKELEKNYPKHRVELNIEKLPSIYGDRLLIRQAVYNILSNAMKFSKHKEPAIIEVACNEHGLDSIFSIKDNGVGFNMKFADNIFDMFTRLHSENDFEGSGTGLAIAKKIINLHGGKVWIKGEVGKGAIFYFTLPSDMIF